MGNSSELAYYNAEKSSLESQKATLENKIWRLRQAKQQVAAIKSDVKQLKKLASNEPDAGSSVWTGTQRDRHVQYVDGTLMDAYQSYINGIDMLEDSIGDEISRLDSQLFNTVGLLDWVWSKIRSLFS